MIPYNQTEAMALEDAFPDFLSGGGIFDALYDYDWIPDSTVALALNQEYFLNRSGRKLASPLVSRLVDSDTGALVTNTINQLGNIISMRFRAKWEKFWQDLIDSASVFQNINYSETTTYGHKIKTDADNTFTKSGSETHTLNGEQDVEESFPDSDGRVTTRSISGGWKDTDTTARTRTGAETTTESFPSGTGRITEKVTKGGWTDTDGTATTRTGVQTVTDSGDTQEAVFGFNSASPVPTSRSGPVSSLTQQTSYGEAGIKDQKSGSITRAYGDTGLQEKTTETGSKQLQTSYGEAGIKDTNSGDVSRLYQNYSDTVSEKGRKLTKTSYGASGKTDELSFTGRNDNNVIDESIQHSGTDGKTVVGYNIRRLTDKLDILKEMYTNPALYDFFEIVYSDIDLVLTCPIFV